MAFVIIAISVSMVKNVSWLAPVPAGAMSVTGLPVFVQTAPMSGAETTVV